MITLVDGRHGQMQLTINQQPSPVCWSHSASCSVHSMICNYQSIVTHNCLH